MGSKEIVEDESMDQEEHIASKRSASKTSVQSKEEEFFGRRFISP